MQTTELELRFILLYFFIAWKTQKLWVKINGAVQKKDRYIHSFGDTILTGIHVKFQSARADLSTERALEKAPLAVSFDALLEILKLIHGMKLKILK